jgi:hypothetical protein
VRRRARRPFGLGYSLPAIERIIADRKLKGVQERAETAEPLAQHGGSRDQGVVNTLVRRGSSNADYLTARIARDRPDILGRMRADDSTEQSSGEPPPPLARGLPHDRSRGGARVSEVARVSVVNQAVVVGACELCATDPVELAAVVLVQHPDGGTVQFVVCERCAFAVRRLLAAVGGQGQARAVEPPVVRATPPRPARRPPRQTRPVAAPERLRETVERFRAADGTEYVARVYGQPTADGLWSGWIEFVAVDSSRARRTGTETTKPNREALVYWASGLEPIYFEGALARAR